MERAINGDEYFDVSLHGIPGDPSMDIKSFHMLWYGNVPVTSSKVSTNSTITYFKQILFLNNNTKFGNRQYYG